MDYQPRSIVLRIHDDGQGFDPLRLALAEGAHFGLLGMRERAKQLGAQLTVKSRPGEGTEVLVEAPLG